MLTIICIIIDEVTLSSVKVRKDYSVQNILIRKTKQSDRVDIIYVDI